MRIKPFLLTLTILAVVPALVILAASQSPTDLPLPPTPHTDDLSVPQLPQPGDLSVPQLPHTIDLSHPGGFCGLFSVEDPNRPLAINLIAKAVGPFSIELSWSGPPGDYELTSYGPTGDLKVSEILGPTQIVNPRAGGTINTAPPNTSRAHATTQVFSGKAINEPTVPDTTYNYGIKATLKGGRSACGMASAKSLPPPIPPAGAGRYVDVNNASLDFTVLPYVNEVTVYRADGSLAASYKKPGQRFEGSEPERKQDQTVDPGPPPFPYDVDKHYRLQPAAYELTVQNTWVGRGATKSVTTPIHVQGPASILGYADLHSHQMAYLGFGGNPGSYPLGRHFFGKAFGPIDTALPWCTPQCGPGGTGDLGNYMMQISTYEHVPPNTGHAVGGYPEFDGYPRWNSFTGQAYYEGWLKRAHNGGLKLIVVHPVNNAWMCTTLNHTSAAEAVTLITSIGAQLVTGGATAPVTGPVTGLLAAKILYWQGQPSDPECLDLGQDENQIREIFAMQDDIDKRIGDEHGSFGKGTGWYRVVLTPQDARKAISEGKLAVVIGMEVDNLFECGLNDAPCSGDTVRTMLAHYKEIGVRHMFPIHFYNNQFGGSANSNLLISQNLKNPMAKRDCQASGFQYDTHQCNAVGLTPLGMTLVKEMMKAGIIIDIDHMSELSFNDTMNLVGAKQYPVVSGHAGFTEIASGDENNEGNRTLSQITQILSVGGMFAVIPHQGTLHEISSPSHFPIDSVRTDIPHTCGNSSQTVAQAYLYAIERTGHGPVGVGTDLNGFAGWPSPRFGSEACSGNGNMDPYDKNSPSGRLVYPFVITATGVSINSTFLDPGPSIDSHGGLHAGIDNVGHNVVGSKKFDFNTDGLAHIGLLPDMIADFEALNMKPEELDPLFFSAEGYIRLWERATYLSSQH